MLNKNISIWRGTQTPPTNYHLWEKEDGGLYIYLDEKWQHLVTPTDKITLDEHQKQLDKIKNLTLTEINPTDNNTYKSYQLKSDNNIFGTTINIPKDRFIKQVALGYGNATVDESTGIITIGTGLSKEYLLFSVALQSGSYELVSINLTNFLTEKDYSDGLEVVDNKLKVKVDPSSEEYLKVSNNGIKIEGINTNFNKINERLTTISNAQIKRSEMGVANGIATLDSNGVIPYNQLPAIADDEDLIEVNNRLKLKDKVYDPDNFSGKGYVILRKNIVEGKNILTQDMINESNTIYEIRYDFDLNDTEITIPENCVLKFNGGSLSNGTINGNYAKIEAETLDNVLINIKYTSPVNFNRSLTYYIIPEIWGIIEGYMEKGEDGHYTEEQYDIMYNNGVAFTKAIEYASNNGFNKVIFPKGKYCFTPFDGVVKYRITYSIWVHDLYNFDIDLNSSELYFIIDDTQKSKYVTFDYGNTYDIRGVLIGLTGCENVYVHNGKLIGDRFIRVYKEDRAKQAESTAGINIIGININIKISDIDVSNFMGDGISASMNNFIYVNYKQDVYYYSTGNITRKTGSPTSDLSHITVEGTSLSDFIDTDTLYTEKYLKSPLLKRWRKHFRLSGSGGYTRLANCYCPRINILVYDGNTEDSKVTRTITCSFLEDFHLYKNERYIKLCFFGDFDIPDEGIQSNLIVTVKGAEGLLIENCQIHDNHRGGFSGSINNTTIRKCIFRKDYTFNTIEVPDYPDATNYFIDIEDSFCRKITVYDCDFVGRASSELLFGCYDLDFFNNRCNQMPSIYNCILANIHNNLCKKGDLYKVSTGWMVNENTIGGAKHMMRHINVYNNYIYTTVMPFPLKSSIINTTINIYNNEYHITSNLLGIDDNNRPSLKYVLENKSIIIENNVIYIDSDNFFNCVLGGIWKNNKILNNIGKDYVYYKNLVIAGISDNNYFEITNPEIAFGEVNNTTFNRMTSYFLTRYYKEDIRKIKLNNVTINNLVCTDPLADNFIVEFNNCTLKFIKGNSALLGCSNTTLIFNACNFITDNNILIPYRLFNDKSTNVKLILKDCLYNGNPIDNTVRLSDIEKKIVCIKRGTTEERPFYVEDDFLYYDTTLKKYIRWNGEEWTNMDGTDLDTPINEWATIE